MRQASSPHSDNQGSNSRQRIASAKISAPKLEAQAFEQCQRPDGSNRLGVDRSEDWLVLERPMSKMTAAVWGERERIVPNSTPITNLGPSTSDIRVTTAMNCGAGGKVRIQRSRHGIAAGRVELRPCVTTVANSTGSRPPTGYLLTQRRAQGHNHTVARCLGTLTSYA